MLVGVSCVPVVVWFASCELGFILLVVSLVVELGCEPVQILWILVVWRMHFSVLYRNLSRSSATADPGGAEISVREAEQDDADGVRFPLAGGFVRYDAFWIGDVRDWDYADALGARLVGSGIENKSQGDPRFTLPPFLTLKNFEGLDLGKMDKADDSGLASYVAGQIDRSLS
ncbi:uncharacterized protein A4U43_C05F10880 [Asparagus officinalis]|uniref:Uncharacterized protein n=1 Tax=Asparagus officinalis TaxID=4686 RepID=A0A5P1ER21_ASPOF|nr:uncharacterized protein A4U43_C05F10880 [Asparagus officinalis]